MIKRLKELTTFVISQENSLNQVRQILEMLSQKEVDTSILILGVSEAMEKATKPMNKSLAGLLEKVTKVRRKQRNH